MNNGEGGSLPQLRTGLLELHQLAMAVFKEGSRNQVADLFEIAVNLEDQVFSMMNAWNRYRKHSLS